MNRSLEVLKDIYKPIRYTIKGKTTILETTSGTFVVKPKEKDLQELYAYLHSRHFTGIPKLIDCSRDGVNVFSYVEDVSYPPEQKAQDLVLLLASLHQKTTFYKDVSLDTYQEIYEQIDGNILYLKNYFNQLFDDYFLEIYPSMSHYLFLRNASKILASLDFAKRELDNWFDLVKEEKRQRVCLIHNRVSCDHFLKGEEDCFISWEASKIDSPVLDFVHFYQTEYFSYDFSSLFQKYQEKYPWNDAEKKLFFLIISLPFEISFGKDEMENCRRVRECLDYVYKTEDLIRPYYTIEED